MKSLNESPESLCASNRYTNFCLTAIVVLLALVVLGVWSQTPSLLNSAGAAESASPVPPRPIGGIPDTGAQRDAMITQQTLTNAKLDEILQVLTSGQVKVTVIGTENKNEDKAYVLPPRTK